MRLSIETRLSVTFAAAIISTTNESVATNFAPTMTLGRSPLASTLGYIDTAQRLHRTQFFLAREQPKTPAPEGNPAKRAH